MSKNIKLISWNKFGNGNIHQYDDCSNEKSRPFDKKYTFTHGICFKALDQYARENRPNARVVDQIACTLVENGPIYKSISFLIG